MNEENKIIDVSMSDMKAAGNPHMLRSSGIGSCVVVTLYDPVKKVGAMAHPMLAEPTRGLNGLHADKTDSVKSVAIRKNPRSLRYVEQAIDAMISELTKMGAKKERLEAKLVGGANMFKVFDKSPDSIGAQNVEAAKKKLEKEGIKVIAADTGENCGRSVVFELTTGVVEVKTKI